MCPMPAAKAERLGMPVLEVHPAPSQPPLVQLPVSLPLHLVFHQLLLVGQHLSKHSAPSLDMQKEPYPALARARDPSAGLPSLSRTSALASRWVVQSKPQPWVRPLAAGVLVLAEPAMMLMAEPLLAGIQAVRKRPLLHVAVAWAQLQAWLAPASGSMLSYADPAFDTHLPVHIQEGTA